MSRVKTNSKSEFNEREARAWDGDNSAQFATGCAYLDGFYDEESDEYFEPNLEQAKMWLETSAASGYSEAQFELAKALRYGDWMSQDLEKSFQWLKRAAENNSDKAMYYLAEYYYRGYGVEKDKNKMIEWLKRSYALGNKDAKKILIEEGIIPQNESEDPTHFTEALLTQRVYMGISFVDMNKA